MTYESIEYDRPPEKVTGTLKTRPSPFGGKQCWINGTQVNPATVRPVEDE
jgi:hypothetical protein